MSLLYHLAYRIGFRPWEHRAAYRRGTGGDAGPQASSPPPELEALVAGADALHPAARSILAVARESSRSTLRCTIGT